MDACCVQPTAAEGCDHTHGHQRGGGHAVEKSMCFAAPQSRLRPHRVPRRARAVAGTVPVVQSALFQRRLGDLIGPAVSGDYGRSSSVGRTRYSTECSRAFSAILLCFPARKNRPIDRLSTGLLSSSTTISPPPATTPTTTKRKTVGADESRIAAGWQNGKQQRASHHRGEYNLEGFEAPIQIVAPAPHIEKKALF